MSIYVSLCILFYTKIKLNYFIDLSLSAVSWFISVDNLKENKPEELSTRPSTTWFESYSRRQPWREPLRQRQVYEDRNQQPGFTHDAEMDPGFRTKTVSSGLARVSLQVCICFFSLQNVTSHSCLFVGLRSVQMWECWGRFTTCKHDTVQNISYACSWELRVALGNSGEGYATKTLWFYISALIFQDRRAAHDGMSNNIHVQLDIFSLVFRE